MLKEKVENERDNICGLNNYDNYGTYKKNIQTFEMDYMDWYFSGSVQIFFDVILRFNNFHRLKGKICL